MLKGYAKPIVFSLLVGMLMLTGVYTYAVQQTGVVPISVVLANDNNQFYRVDIEAQLPSLQTVNYTITAENTTAFIPAGSTIVRIIPYMNATAPYIYPKPLGFLITIQFYITYTINGETAGNATSVRPSNIAVDESYTVVTLAGSFWLYKSLSLEQVWEINIRAVSSIAQ